MKSCLVILPLIFLQIKGISQTNKKNIFDFLPVGLRLGENIDSCRIACDIRSLPTERKIKEALYPRKVDYIFCQEFLIQFLGMKIQNIYLSVDSNKIQAIQIFLFYQHGIVKNLVDKFGIFITVGEFLNGNSDSDETVEQLINNENASSYIWKLGNNLFMNLTLTKNQFEINDHKNSTDKDSAFSILTIYNGNVGSYFQLSHPVDGQN